MGPLQDSSEPTSFLVEPAQKANDILGQPLADPGMVLDWLSPTHIVNEFVKALCGYDFFGEAAKFLSRGLADDLASRGRVQVPGRGEPGDRDQPFRRQSRG
jgi:hypothetical protein